MEERQLLLLCTLILLDVVFMSWRLMTLNPRGMKVIASVQHRGNRKYLLDMLDKNSAAVL